jgi:hypothetical protein
MSVHIPAPKARVNPAQGNAMSCVHAVEKSLFVPLLYGTLGIVRDDVLCQFGNDGCPLLWPPASPRILGKTLNKVALWRVSDNVAEIINEPSQT